jgi:hypothetical protein
VAVPGSVECRHLVVDGWWMEEGTMEARMSCWLLAMWLQVKFYILPC